MLARQWIISNCLIGLQKLAAFQPPQKGDRIELSNRPGEYYLVLEKPQVGQDPRGMSFWYARAKDSTGREQTLNSDNIASWKHFRGQNYKWHDEDVAKQQWEKQQESQAAQIEGFESKYVFPDHQPLRKNPGRPMTLLVKKDAAGALGAFAGERVQVKDIDYQTEAVTLEPVNPEFADLGSGLIGIPAGEVVQFADPAMRPEVKAEPVRLPNGQVITAEQLMQMTPSLNELARRGQISLKAQVYQNYSNAKGLSGEDYFIRDMSMRGISPEEVAAATQYKLNTTPAKLDDRGHRQNIFGAWQGDVVILPPIGDLVKNEIASIAPASKIQLRKDGSYLVQSNPLYKQFVGLGVLDQARAV